MQRTQFHAKIAKNDLKPMDFLQRNFYFETEGVLYRLFLSISLVELCIINCTLLFFTFYKMLCSSFKFFLVLFL